MTKLKKVNLFATKSSIQEALDYGISIGMATNNSAAVTTALFVLYNTMISYINKEHENETV